MSSCSVTPTGNSGSSVSTATASKTPASGSMSRGCHHQSGHTPGDERSSNAVRNTVDAHLGGAVGAAEVFAVRFYAVAHHHASAVGALRREHVDRALKTV